MRTLVILLTAFVAIALVIWLGFRIPPKPYPALALSPLAETNTERRVDLPDGLPAPVERFYRTVYGESVPVIETAIVDGRARLSPMGFFMPARFRFIYNAGSDYRHNIETTFYGLPIMKVYEAWIDGASRFRIPIVGTSENNPKENEAANLGLWAEMAFFPSVLLTHPGVQWLPVDDDTAILEAPFVQKDAPASTQRFIVRFDPDSGMLRSLEAMRYRSREDAKRILWITEFTSHGAIDPQGWGFAAQATNGTATWLDQGKPWAYFNPDEFHFNVEVDTLLYADPEKQ